jgi:hypothetical protein
MIELNDCKECGEAFLGLNGLQTVCDPCIQKLTYEHNNPKKKCQECGEVKRISIYDGGYCPRCADKIFRCSICGRRITDHYDYGNRKYMCSSCTTVGYTGLKAWGY